MSVTHLANQIGGRCCASGARVSTEYPYVTQLVKASSTVLTLYAGTLFRPRVFPRSAGVLANSSPIKLFSVNEQ